MTPSLEPVASRLEVAALRFAYPGQTVGLEGISFTLEPGERLAVLGGNGAGKTTLLLHLNGLLLPKSGHVAVDGIRVRPESLREVRRRVGLVFQNPDDQLFLPTVLEDVAFGPLNHGTDAAEAEQCARQTLTRLGLPDSGGRAGHHLSGGEKRLAALATVLVSRPSLLVLDEPSADLDARARARLAGLLCDTAASMVVATHDLELAGALCDRAIILSRGQLAATGALRDLLQDVDLLRYNGLIDPLMARGW